MKNYLEKIIQQQSLTEEEMKHAASYLFSEEVTDTEIASFITGLKMKGETVEEIVGINGYFKSLFIQDWIRRK